MSTTSESEPRVKRGGPLIMPWVCAALLVGALCCAFLIAPRESEMGEIQRIYYFHVASAFAALGGWVGCALCSIAYLVLAPRPRQSFLADAFDRVAYALAEVGVLFGLVVLVTGPLWAGPVWGKFWTWEPRLVLMLLVEFLFIGYLVLRAYAKRDARGKKLAAGIALVGGPTVYLIHVAVTLWGGNHPNFTEEGGLKAPLMKLAFWIAVAAVVTFASYLTYLRVQHHKLIDDIEDGFLDLADREDQR